MKSNTHNITSINVNGNLSFNSQIIVEIFSKYFLSVAQSIRVNNHNVNASSNHKHPVSYLSRACYLPFTIINLKHISSKEIEDTK
jgi:hypothetical protein